MARAQAGRIEFTNHLMFNAVLTENEDICRRLIGGVIGRPVERVEYLDDEHSLQPEIDSRGARLDVLALVDGEYVDVEMQVGSEPDITRRCRFYHSAIATRYTPKGTGYESVPRSCVIFICMSDPLDADLPRYELATTCLNNPSTNVDDGATTILLNASAWRQEKNPDVAGMLRYALTGSFDGGLAADIAHAVDSKNLDRGWVRASMGVMTYEHEFIVLNHELERRQAQIEATQAKLEDARARVDSTRAELEATEAQARSTQAELDSARAQARSTQEELDSAREQARSTQAELDSAREQARSTQAELESARTNARVAQSELESARTDARVAQAQADAAQAQIEAAQSEAEAARARAYDASRAAKATQELSKLLYAQGRIDEYFAALDNPELMKTLLKEFGLL